MQLKKKSLHDFTTKYAQFTFEENLQAGPVLKINVPNDHHNIFTVAMDPKNGEVHSCNILVSHACISFSYRSWPAKLISGTENLILKQ